MIITTMPIQLVSEDFADQSMLMDTTTRTIQTAIGTTIILLVMEQVFIRDTIGGDLVPGDGMLDGMHGLAGT